MEQKKTHAIVEEFLNTNGYEFQLSRVCGIVGASLKDVTNWRQRGVLPFEPQKLAGRYCVSQLGFVSIGVMSELAWLLGPEVASKVAQTVLEDLFFNSPFQMKYEDFKKLTLSFEKPLSENVKAAIQYPRLRDEDDMNPLASTGFELVYRQLGDDEVWPQRTRVTVPLGILVSKWAVHYAYTDGVSV